MHQNARRSVNRKVALTCARAGLFVFPSSSKVPLVLTWQRADSAIGEDGIEEIRAVARKKATAAGRTFDEETFIGCTKDVAKIKLLWRRFPDAVPSISLGPSGLYVLDCDIDETRNGPQLAADWLKANGINTSLCPMTRSQSGGLHIFFAGPDLRSHIGPTLKAMYVQGKAQGGQVIAPGAVREDGRRYMPEPGQPELASAFAMKALPAVPAPILALQAERSEVAEVSDDATSNAIGEMRGDLPEINFDPNVLVKASGNCSNDRYALALDLARSHGSSFTPGLYRATIENFEAAGEYVTDRPSPGQFDDRQLAREFVKAKIAVAESNARRAEALRLDTPTDALVAIEAAVQAGEQPDDEIERLLSALDNFDAPSDVIAATRAAANELVDAYVLDMGKPEALALVRSAVTGERSTIAKPKPGRGYKSESAMFADIELTAWTIDDILPEHGVGFIVGASHTGKTFAAIDMMGSLAQGGTWFGRQIYEPVCSLYIGGEDVEEIPGRILAWTLKNGSTQDRVGVMDVPPNLASDAKALREIVAVVKNLKADTGIRCGLIVLDTVASLAVGLKENDATEVGQLVDLMRKVARATGAAVLGVHHPRKGSDGSEGRGSGAFYNNATFEFRLAKKKGVRRGLFQVHKNKFAASDVSGLPFQLDPVEIGTNRHGKLVTTLVFGKAEASEFPPVDLDEDDDVAAQPVRGQDRVLAAAKRAVERHGSPVKRAVIADELEADGERPIAGNSLGPLLGRLVDDGALVRSGRRLYGLPE